LNAQLGDEKSRSKMPVIYSICFLWCTWIVQVIWENRNETEPASIAHNAIHILPSYKQTYITMRSTKAT